MTEFLPGMEQNNQLASHLVILIGNLWAEEIPALVWFKNHLPAVVPHQYMKELKHKTEKVSNFCTLPLYNRLWELKYYQLNEY